MGKCYITEQECEYYDGEGEECVAEFIEQCPIDTKIRDKFKQKTPIKTEPFIAVGNNELSEDIEDFTECPNCGRKHKVIFPEEDVNGKKLPTKIFGYVRCGKESYVVAIGGKKWKSTRKKA